MTIMPHIRFGVLLGGLALAGAAAAQNTVLPLHSGTWTADAYIGEKQQKVCEINAPAVDNPAQILKIWHGYGQTNMFALRGLVPYTTATLHIADYTETWTADAIGRIDTGGVADPTIIRLMLEQATQKNAPALRVTTMLADGKAPVTLTYPLAGFPQAYAACAPGKY